MKLQNPTGSFKDRDIRGDLADDQASRSSDSIRGKRRRLLFGRLRCASRRAAHVFMPRDTPLANQLETRQYGAHLTLVDGLINDCGRIIAKKNRRRLVRFFHSQGAVSGRGEKKDGLRDRRSSSTGICPDVIMYPPAAARDSMEMKSFNEIKTARLDPASKRRASYRFRRAAIRHQLEPSTKAGKRRSRGRTRTPSRPACVCPRQSRTS